MTAAAFSLSGRDKPTHFMAQHDVDVTRVTPYAPHGSVLHCHTRVTCVTVLLPEHRKVERCCILPLGERVTAQFMAQRDVDVTRVTPYTQHRSVLHCRTHVTHVTALLPEQEAFNAPVFSLSRRDTPPTLCFIVTYASPASHPALNVSPRHIHITRVTALQPEHGGRSHTTHNT